MYEFNNSDLRAIQLEGFGDMAKDILHFNGRKREQDLISMNKYVGKQWLDMNQHSLNISYFILIFHSLFILEVRLTSAHF